MIPFLSLLKTMAYPLAVILVMVLPVLHLATKKSYEKGGKFYTWMYPDEEVVDNLTVIDAVKAISFMVVMLGLVWLAQNYIPELLILLYLSLGVFIVVVFLDRIEALEHLKQRMPFLLAYVLTGSFALVAGFGWWLFPSWLTYNLIGLIMIYTLVSYMRLVKTTFIFAALFLLIFFDIWGVWQSGLIPEMASAIETTVTIPEIHQQAETRELYLPLQLLIPANISKINMFAILTIGLGDIGIPGLVIACMRKKYNLYLWTLSGYIIGVFLALALVYVLNLSVPAMITIAPCLIVSMLIGAWRNNIKFKW